jgi:hypothetical protein
MRKFNSTGAWVLKSLNAASYAWCRQEARQIDENGEARRVRAN